MQALIVKFYSMFEKNTTFRVYRRALINENKWRAQRWGLDGKMIDFGKRAEVDTKALVYEIVELVDDVVDDLGSRTIRSRDFPVACMAELLGRCLVRGSDRRVSLCEVFVMIDDMRNVLTDARNAIASLPMETQTSV
jgi:hypothetical protein